MSSTLWNDQNLFLTTLKIRISPKTLLFSDERGSDTNYWWEKPLVVTLKHSEGIKHKVLFQEHKSLQQWKSHKKLNTRPLSFFLVFLSNLSTHNSISSAGYLYTNSKQDNSTFKCEGGWRLAANSWWLVAGGWAVTAGSCLPWPSRWIEFNTTVQSFGVIFFFHFKSCE